MCIYKYILENQGEKSKNVEKVIVMEAPNKLIAYEQARDLMGVDELKTELKNLHIKVEEMKDKSLGLAFYFNKVT